MSILSLLIDLFRQDTEHDHQNKIQLTFANQYKYTLEDFNVSYNPSNYDKSLEKKGHRSHTKAAGPKNRIQGNEDVPSVVPHLHNAATDFEVLDTVESRTEDANNSPDEGFSEEEEEEEKKNQETDLDLDQGQFQGQN